METFEWLAPQPLWKGMDLKDAGAMRGPVIAKFSGDDFMDRFLAAVESDSIGSLETTAAGEKLYLPFHASYHLVLASLVCNRLGFPDRALDPSQGESVGFVLRRLGVSDSDESAWIPGKGWVALHDVEALGESEAAVEEVFPMVRSKVGGRCVWQGFVPLASGESAGGQSKFGASPGAERFVLRCLYRRPQCKHSALVVSEPSPLFTVSTFLDPEAAHRPIEIGLDLDGAVAGLQKSVTFKLKGHAAQAVDKVLDNLPGDFPSISKQGLVCDSPGFSIPWITLVAFILLMIITAILWPIFALFAIPLSLLLPGGKLCPDGDGIPS